MEDFKKWRGEIHPSNVFYPKSRKTQADMWCIFSTTILSKQVDVF